MKGGRPHGRLVWRSGHGRAGSRCRRGPARWRPVTSGQVRRPNARALPLGRRPVGGSGGGRSLGGPAMGMSKHAGAADLSGGGVVSLAGGGRRVRPCRPALRAGPVGPRGRPGGGGAHGGEAAAAEGNLVGLEAPPAPGAPGRSEVRAARGDPVHQFSRADDGDQQQVGGPAAARHQPSPALCHDLDARLGPEQGRRGRPGETPAGAAVVLDGTGDRGDAHPAAAAAADIRLPVRRSAQLARRRLRAAVMHWARSEAAFMDVVGRRRAGGEPIDRSPSHEKAGFAELCRLTATS